MKNFYLLLILFSLLNMFLCEENITDNATDIANSTNENTTAVSKEEKEGSSFKTLEISLKLISYLNSLKNLTTIEKEQLRGIFQNIYDLIVDDPEKKLNSSDSEMIDKFTDEVFESLADKEKNAIMLKEIYEQYNISKIMDFITRFLKSLNLESILGPLVNLIIKILGEMISSYFSDSDL